MKIEGKDLGFAYSNQEKPILEHLNFSLESGEITAVKGQSGRGKTTLCKLIGGYLAPTSGCLLYDGGTLKRNGAFPIQMVFQNPERAVNPKLKMEDILSDTKGIDSSIIQGLGIQKEWLTRFPHELSGGELQRFCIARALGKDTRYLLADEITTMFDLITQVEIWEFLLDEVRRREIGVLMVSHNEALLNRIATKYLVL